MLGRVADNGPNRTNIGSVHRTNCVVALLSSFPANTTLTQGWFNVRPMSKTVGQHCTNIVAMSRVCRVSFIAIFAPGQRGDFTREGGRLNSHRNCSESTPHPSSCLKHGLTYSMGDAILGVTSFK